MAPCVLEISRRTKPFVCHIQRPSIRQRVLCKVRSDSNSPIEICTRACHYVLPSLRWAVRVRQTLSRRFTSYRKSHLAPSCAASPSLSRKILSDAPSPGRQQVLVAADSPFVGLQEQRRFLLARPSSGPFPRVGLDMLMYPSRPAFLPSVFTTDSRCRRKVSQNQRRSRGQYEYTPRTVPVSQ